MTQAHKGHQLCNKLSTSVLSYALPSGFLIAIVTGFWMVL